MEIQRLLKIKLLDLVSQNLLSQLVGWGSLRQLPAPVLKPLLNLFARTYNIDLTEAADPLDSFDSLNEFFVRRLREDARPIGNTAVVSPADGRLAQFGEIDDGLILQVKGIPYQVVDLLLGDPDAGRFTDGLYFTVYLSPRNYHRVHAPFDGEVSGYRYIPGRLFPVNDLAVRTIPGLFTLNERLISYLETDLGRVAVVMVGATSVGRMSVVYHPVTTNNGGREAHSQTLELPWPLRRGDELGCFNLGSTVVVLMEKGSLEFVDGLSAGQTIELGNPLLRRIDG